MKTQVIQLNQNDDLVSVKDKMSASQIGRILLVWPPHGQVLNRKLELNLVKRYAATLGTQLAFVTHDSEVHFYAQQLGIPVFVDPRPALEQDWGTSEQARIQHRSRADIAELVSLRKSVRSQPPLWQDHPAVKALCLAITVLAIAALAFLLLPGAKVIITPREAVQSMQLDLTADPSATAINVSTGSLPTYSQEVAVEGTDTITATGFMPIADEPASGMLKFSNHSKAEITLPAMTFVSTIGNDRVRFITTAVGDLTVKPNKSILVEARAIKPGISGNLPANRLVAIEGELGLVLAVTNPEATSGGLVVIVPTPTTQDLQSVHQRLSKKLIQEAIAELQARLPGEDVLIHPSAVVVEELEKSYSPTSGEPGERVKLTLRLKIKAQVVSGALLRGLVNPILDSNIPAGYNPIINSLVITALSSPIIEADGKAYWSVNVQRDLQADIPTHQAIESIKGLTPVEAERQLSESIPLNEQTSIRITPGWWPRLPFLAMRITMVQADKQ